MASTNPEGWMRRAIRNSRRGFPAPNPHVGCVVVQNDELVGAGWHAFAGGLHAEAAALSRAKEAARDADVYVTLEPCNHHGRQPPCTQALIAAGVKRVFVACPDPNPRVEGGGARALREAGVEVIEGILQDEAEQENGPWLHSMRLGRPYVALKAAMSLDGRIALSNGESRWITGPEARREAHRLRAEMGSVLVGYGTVVKDDPALTARISGVKTPPVRIVLDPDRALEAHFRVFQEPGVCLRAVRPERAQEGDLAIPSVEGKFDLEQLLAELWAKGVTGVLVEGGAVTLTGFLKAGLADRIDLFAGNVIFGAGPTWVSEALADTLGEAARWRLRGVKKLGDDVLMKFESE